MKRRLQNCLLCGLVAAMVVGCGAVNKEPPPRVPPETTAAGKAVKTFFEAIVKKDWKSAYGSLDAKSKAGCTEENFAKLGDNYYQSIGFEPSEVLIQSCDERGDSAIAHVNLKGVSGSSLKFHKDAVGLRHEATGWAVELPANFGEAKPHKS